MRISDWSSDVCSSDLVDLSSNCCHASFSTFTARTKAPGALNFILGSCRYPGVLWKVKEADLIFGPLRSEALGCGPRDAELDVQVPTTPAQFVLMAGDQIYADMLNRQDRKSTRLNSSH